LETSAAPSINLSKITLEKKGDAQTINLAKQDQEIVINLNWQQKKKLFGLLGAVDLDLGCFFELRDGSKSCIDGIQFAHGAGGPRHLLTAQGCYSQAPWIWHMGDDRSGGQMAQGENILVNPRGFGDLKRMTIYAFIYEGAARWLETNAVVTVKVPGNPEVEVRMGEQTSNDKFCVIADLSFEGSDSVVVTKSMTFHEGHAGADAAYRWGMQWQPGSK
jgi:tellurite resistance protein TerA